LKYNIFTTPLTEITFVRENKVRKGEIFSIQIKYTDKKFT